MPPAGDRLVALAKSPRVHALAILGIGLAGLLVYAFPGFMSSDSAAQLGDARSGQYTDWHPPAMAAIWTVLDAIIAGPALMLLLQATLFLAGTYRILRRVFAERAAAIAASAILLAPPVIAPMAVIWKDSQMAGFLMMGTSLLLSSRRWSQIVGIVLLAIATAYRDNAAAATLPILVLLLRIPRLQRWAQITAAVAIWVATVGAAVTANRALTKVNQHAWYVSLGPADIIGVLEKARPHSDAELLALLDGAPLVVRSNIQQHAQTFYNPTMWWWYMSGPRRMFDWPTTAAQREVIARAWRSIVFGNPRAYFFHRLRVFRGVLATNRTPVFDPVWTTHIDLPRHGTPDQFVDADGVQADIGAVLKWIAAETPLFRPYVYFALAFVLVALAWRQREVVALLASGISYELALFFIAPSPDYRYSHWMVSCTIVAAVIVATQRIRSARRSGDAQTVG